MAVLMLLKYWLALSAEVSISADGAPRAETTADESGVWTRRLAMKENPIPPPLESRVRNRRG
jgi:hypothetical protein